jgi:hypothetical protein
VIKFIFREAKLTYDTGHDTRHTTQTTRHTRHDTHDTTMTLVDRLLCERAGTRSCSSMSASRSSCRATRAATRSTCC